MQRIIQTVSAEAAAHLQIRRAIVAALGVSLVTNAALALTLLTKTDNSRTIVLSPAATQTYIATDESVSPNLMESFASESASVLLTMTPATASSNAEIFLKNVAPHAYGAMASVVRRGASELVRNYASSVFYRHASAVDETAKSVCLTGERRMMIASTVTETSDVTVCMRYVVTAGRLQISQLTIRPSQSSDPAAELAAFTQSDATVVSAETPDTPN